MDVGKSFFRCLAAVVWLPALTGCADFLAVADAPGPEGGVYRVQAGGAFQCAKVQNLSALVRDARTGLLYGTVNRRGGGVVVLDNVPGGGIGVVQTVATGGRTGCHLTLSPDGGFLYTANYASGDVSEFRLKDGFPHGRSRRIRHRGRGVTPRQKSPHPHFVGFDPSGKHLYVCDLGCDRIFVYPWTREAGVDPVAAEQLILPPGSGPRHLVFAPDGDTLYVANELDSTVASFVRAPEAGKWRPARVRSTLPAGADRSKNYPGAIRITRDGRFFFVTNRGHDSVAVFATAAGGEFRPLAVVPTGGEFPSDLLLLDDDRLLAVCHRRSGGVACFDWDAETGRLTPRSGRAAVPRAAGLCL